MRSEKKELHTSLNQARLMSASGSEGSEMDTVSKHGLMAQFTKASGGTTEHTVRASSSTLTETFMKETG